MLVFYVLAIGALIAPSLQNHTPLNNLTITHVWKNLEYGFNSEAELNDAIANGYQGEGFKRPYDVDVSVPGKRCKGRTFNRFSKACRNCNLSVFITSPRIMPGTPYSLGIVSNNVTENGPVLKPYPDYKSHSPTYTPGCDRIISVVRVYVDPCNRLWTVDIGRNFQVTPSLVCPPKILAYDLNTNKLVLRYTIPEDQYVLETSTHNGIIVDIYDPPPKGECKYGKAYLTDARGFSFLVFDLERKVSWVIYNELFKPDPNYSTTTIAGESFLFPDGLYTSTPYRRKDILRLHSYSSLSEIGARLSLVNNQSLWAANSSGHQEVFQVVGTRPTQSPTQAIDSKGLIYSSLLNPLSIFSWDPQRPYKTKNFKTVVQNDEILQFAVGAKVVRNCKNEEMLLVLSNRLQKLNTRTISIEEDNFRVMVCRTSTLQSGRGKCGSL